MALTKQQLRENDKFFSVMITITESYYWLDEREFFEIKDDKFVLDTPKKVKLMRNNTTNKWFNDNTIVL